MSARKPTNCSTPSIQAKTSTPSRLSASTDLQTDADALVSQIAHACIRCPAEALTGRKYCAAHQERANGQTLQEKITEQREAQPADLQRIQGYKRHPLNHADEQPTFDPANCPNFAALAQIEKHADNALAMPNWNQDELISALAVIAQTAGAAVATHQAKIAAYRVQDLDGAEPDMERDRR